MENNNWESIIEKCKYKETEVLDLKNIDYPKLASEIQSFINRQLDSQKANLIVEIEGMKKVQGMGKYGHPEVDLITGYNQAISDIVKRIKQI